MYSSFLFYCTPLTRALPPFPTRRSSDLTESAAAPACASRCRRRCRRGSKLRDENGSDDSAAVLIPQFRAASARSEEHTSELQSRFDLVCRLLLEKKKK